VGWQEYVSPSVSTGISLWTHLKKGEMKTLPNLKPLSFSAAAVACIQGIDQIQIFAALSAVTWDPVAE